MRINLLRLVRRPSRIGKLGLTLLRLMVVLTILGAVGFLVLRVTFHGPRLGAFVSERINGRISGHVEIGSIEWPAYAIGDPHRVPLIMRDVRLQDPDGRIVLAVPRMDLVVDAWEILTTGGRNVIAVGPMILRGTPEQPPYLLVRHNRMPGALGRVGIAVAMNARPGLAGPAPGEQKGRLLDLPWIIFKDADLDLDFPGWQASGHGLDARAHVFLSESQDVLDYGIHGEVDHGQLDIGGQRFGLDHLVLGESGQLASAPEDLVWAASVGGPEGSHVWVNGALRGLNFGHATRLEMAAGIDKGGKLAARYLPNVEPRDSTSLFMSLAGPVSALVLEATVTDVNLQPGNGIPQDLGDLHLQTAKFGLELSTGKLTLRQASADLLGGIISATGSATLGSRPSFDFSLAADPALEVEPFLPPQLASLARGGQLAGHLHLAGDEQHLVVDGLDVTLGTFRVTGGLAWTGSDQVPSQPGMGWALMHGVLEPSDLEVEAAAESTKVKITRGEIDLMKRELRVGFSASIGQLVPWLRRLGVKGRLATSAAASGDIRGSLDAPVIEANVSHVRGVPFMDQLEAHVVFTPGGGGTLALSNVRGHTLGGLVLAGGRIRLGKHPVLENGFANGRGLELARLPGSGGLLGGEASFNFTLLGPLTRPAAAGVVVAQNLTLGGEPLGDLTADLEADEHGLILERLELAHQDAHLLGHGTVGYDQSLDLTLSLQRLPVATLPGLADAPGLGVDGNASLELHATGTIQHPDLVGTLGLSEIAFGQTLFGAGNLDIAMKSPGVVGLHGSLFQGKVQVDADVMLSAPYWAHAVVAFERLELDEFTPIAAKLGLTGWASGKVTIASEGKLAVSGRITELRGEVVGEDSHGRPVPVAVHNEGDVVFAWDGVGATLSQPAVLVTPEGKVTIARGKVSPHVLDVQIKGELALGLLEGFTRRALDNIAGAASIKLSISGSPEAPRMNGEMTLRDVKLRPRGVESELSAPTGHITFANDRVQIDQLSLSLEGHTLDVTGGLALRDYAPDKLELKVKGRLAAQLLSLVAGRQVSDASGSAAIDLAFSGTVSQDGRLDQPRLDGSITFDQPFNLAIRGLRREITVQGGMLAVHGHRLTVERRLLTRIDDGDLAIKKGGIIDVNDKLELTGVDLGLELSSFVQRQPEVYEVEFDTTDMTLTMDAGILWLRGNVDIVQGRFLQKFDYVGLLTPKRTLERNRPFYEGVRLLETMQLDFRVKSNGAFRIDNNIASGIALDGDILVTGSLPDPRFGGLIKASSGRIKFLVIRPTFDIDSGEITFDPSKEIRSGAYVNLAASSTYIDSAERSHRVHMLAHGPLAGVAVTFSTEEGLNSVQTLALITLGRTDDQLREQARGDTGNNTTNADLAQTGAGASNLGGTGVGGVADRVIKDVAGDFMTTLVGDLMRDRVGLDCFSVNVGIASASVYGCKKFLERIKVDAQWEYGYTGVNILRVGGELRLQNNLSLRAFLKEVQSTDPLTEETSTGGFELKFRWILK